MMTTELGWIRGYEDAYEGCGVANGQELLQSLEDAGSPFAYLNVPVWIDVPSGEYEDDRRLSVGVMMPRKGRACVFFTDDWTQEDLMAIRQLMLRVWALRADTGFSRWQQRAEAT